MTHEELLNALETLGLSDRVTLREITSRYRNLAKRHHPDKGIASDSSQIAKINAAYAAVLAYVKAYRFSFTEKEFYVQNPDERLRRQFSDPLWEDA